MKEKSENVHEKEFDTAKFAKEPFRVEEEFKNIYFKLVCYYHAKTEEYDRTLTDLRDRYDPTSAYVTGIQARYSNSYAQAILRKISKAGFSSKLFDEMLHKYTRNQPAQWWVDTYHYLLENGEMEDAQEMMREDRKEKDLHFIKNPFL